MSQYLYKTRKLDLPGFGSFTMDPSAVIPEESEKGAVATTAGIIFKNTAVHAPDDGLIGFIKEHTGKMKPLAAADLDFFLTTGKQLLNIGKPFYLEGIGTLTQNKSGLLDFIPGEYMIARKDEPSGGKKDRSEKKSTGFDEPPREFEPKNNNVRQSLLLAGLVGGLIIIGWGGYYLYKRNTYVEPASETKVAAAPDTTATRDSSTVTGSRISQQPGPTVDTPGTKKTDSSPKPAVAIQSPPPVVAAVQLTPGPGENLYRFVILETANKVHALRRYNQLLGYQLNIKMEQKDSSSFKLYFPIPATIRDTSHIRDSLADVYAAHVRIEP